MRVLTVIFDGYWFVLSCQAVLITAKSARIPRNIAILSVTSASARRIHFKIPTRTEIGASVSRLPYIADTLSHNYSDPVTE